MTTDKPLCTAADLNGRYLGRRMRITNPSQFGDDTSIQGVLSGVEHGANLIAETSLGTGVTGWALGQTWVQVSILNYGGARVRPGANVELLD